MLATMRRFTPSCGSGTGRNKYDGEQRSDQDASWLEERVSSLVGVVLPSGGRLFKQSHQLRLGGKVIESLKS